MSFRKSTDHGHQYVRQADCRYLIILQDRPVSLWEVYTRKRATCHAVNHKHITSRNATQSGIILPETLVLTTLRMQLQTVFHCSSLSTLDPGSGREIAAIWHGIGVWHGYFTLES